MFLFGVKENTMFGFCINGRPQFVFAFIALIPLDTNASKTILIRTSVQFPQSHKQLKSCVRPKCREDSS